MDESVIVMVSAGLTLGVSFRLLGILFRTLHRNLSSIVNAMTDFR